MNPTPTFASIGLYFAALSLMAIGGVNAVIPDMHLHFVEQFKWIEEREFVELVALAQAAPGPNVLVVSLIGWRIDGWVGAAAATIGMCVPSSVLAYGFAKFWQRFEHTRWRAIVRDGLAPVTVGLVLASGYVVTDAADHGWVAYGVTALTVTAAVLTKLHPLWILSAAGLLGVFGIV